MERVPALGTLAMATRLLSLLSLVESALVGHNAPALAAPTTRTVSFHKGLARLSFGDGSGNILLQSFVLADGQNCVKALLSWTGTELTRSEAIYPHGNFNWAEAADRIAQAWMAGPPAASVVVSAGEMPAEGSHPQRADLAATA
jgi:hypothetical protein